MKKILFKMMMLSCMVLTAFTSMAQGSFAYQAVIRDSKGQLVCDKTVGMRFTLSYDSKDYYQETQSTKTNAYGNVSVMVGSGTVVSGTFMSVPWNTMKIMMKVEVSVDNSDYINLGAIQIQPAPYAMYAASFNTELQAADGAAEDVPLFSVKNSDGELVFAVYPSGVKVYVDDDESKAMRSSFAVSKRHSAAKDGAEAEIFSVGNFGTTVYVDDDESKAMRSSFAVSGRHSAVKDGETNNYLSVNAEGTTVYVDDDENKAMRSSFAVSGRHSATKDGETNDYLSVNAEGTQVYVDDDESKAMRSSFAVSGRHSATKDGNSDDLFSVSGSDVNIAASSFNVSDKESEKVVFAVNNSKVNVKSDILMTGGIGNVDEEVAQVDDILELDDIIEVRADDAYYGYYGLVNDESSVLVKNGVTSISDVTLYGIDENGSLIKAKADGSNYLQCLYYDKSGASVWKETDYNVTLDDQQISLKVPAKAVATAKFCVVAKYYDYVGDDEVEKSVRVDFTLKSDDIISGIVGDYENPYANYEYKTCKITYKYPNESGFVYYNMGSYEYFDMGSNVYVVLVDNGDDFKTAYICEKSGTGYKVVEDEDQYEFYSGLPCYSWNNYMKYADLEGKIVSCDLFSEAGYNKTYLLMDADGTQYYVGVEYGYVTKFSVGDNVILDYDNGGESTSYGGTYQGLDSDLLKQLKIGDSGDAFAATD